MMDRNRNLARFFILGLGIMAAALALGLSPVQAAEQKDAQWGDDPSAYGKDDTALEKTIKRRQKGSSVSLWASLSRTVATAETALNFEGTLNSDDAKYEATGEWDVTLSRVGLRLDMGKGGFKFRLGFYYQRMDADYESDGTTLIEYTTLPDQTDMTVLESFRLTGGGLELGFNTFIGIKVAKGADGVARFVFGPTLGLALVVSGGMDRERDFQGGWAGFDLDLGLRFQLFNILVLFAEVGVMGGAFGGMGGEFEFTVGSNFSWKGMAGIGMLF